MGRHGRRHRCAVGARLRGVRAPPARGQLPRVGLLHRRRIAFGIAFGQIAGWEFGTEYFAGYIVVSGLLDRLVYLSTGLSAILAFVGVKLVLHHGLLQEDSIPEIETSTSLVVIGVVLAVTTVASLVKVRSDPSARAHAGSLRGHDDHAERR